VQLIHLPLSVWRTFGLEARFGFNRTTPALFLADLGRGLALAVALGAPVLTAILLLMERAVRWWWVWAWGLWLAVMLLMTWAWPAFIAPLFNRFVPLPDLALRERLEALLDRCGFTSRGVFVVDSSRRSTHGNAYFTGIGRHKRIVFFDTLLEQLAHPEVEAVLAHELGHFRLRHVRQRLLLSVALAFAGLALLGWLSRAPGFYAALGVPVPSTHAALLLFAFAAPAFTFFVTPLGSLWSRRHEFEADDFASRHASAAELASALVKLHRDNASTLTPDALYAAFYYSHPPPRPENHERRQRLALQVRRATVGDAELRDAELRGAQLQPSQILPPVQIRIDQHPLRVGNGLIEIRQIVRIRGPQRAQLPEHQREHYRGASRRGAPRAERGQRAPGAHRDMGGADGEKGIQHQDVPDADVDVTEE